MKPKALILSTYFCKINIYPSQNTSAISTNLPKNDGNCRVVTIVFILNKHDKRLSAYKICKLLQ